MNEKTSPAALVLLIVLLATLVLSLAAPACADDLLRSAGRDLKPAQEKFIEEKVESLRESDQAKRFQHLVDLIRLDRFAVPFLEEEVEQGSNPIPVRCAILALAEIAPPGIADGLARLVKGTKVGRDEKGIAILGLGRVGGSRDSKVLNALLRKGEDRFHRRAAALALARLGDRQSVKSLMTAAPQEREERVAVTFLLAAALIGGDEYATRMNKIIRGMDRRRQRALLLGAAMNPDPGLLPVLLKYGPRDKKNHRALAVVLGRYSDEQAVAWLRKALSGPEEEPALEALYSLARVLGDGAASELLRVLEQPSTSEPLRAHALLAAAEAGFRASFLQPARKRLSDAAPAVRSAAALALVMFDDRGAVPLLEKALDAEEERDVLADLLVAFGLMGSAQDAEKAEAIAAGAADPELESLAQKVSKVMRAKVDRRVLLEDYDRRLSSLSVGWGYRLRDAFLEEIRFGMDLDTIYRPVYDSGTTTQEEDPPSGEQGGGGETGEEPPQPEAPGVGEQPGQPGPTTQGTPGGTPSGGTSQGWTRRRVLIRGEVVEWDILHWFNDLGYFPDELFSRR